MTVAKTDPAKTVADKRVSVSADEGWEEDRPGPVSGRPAGLVVVVDKLDLERGPEVEERT